MPYARSAPESRADSVQSRILHPAGGSDLAQRLAHASLAATHAVTPEMQVLLRAERYPEFFAARGTALEKTIGTFLGARMRLGETDRPSIAALVVAEAS